MTAKDFYLSLPVSENPATQFLRLGEEYAAAWAKAGVTVRVTRSKDLAEFRKASKKIQHHALCYLQFNVSVLNEMMADGESPKDTKRFIWRIIKKMQLIPPSDMMNYIEDDDIVELYFADEIQFFRNFRFMELTSYTMEELLCRPWFKLASRPWRPMLKMFRVALRFKLGRLRERMAWNIPEHVLQEINTAECLRLSIQLKYLIPLYDGHSYPVVLATNQSRRCL